MNNLSALYLLLRARHWVKNLFLFSAPLFGGTLFLAENAGIALASFTSFSLCASAVYIMNDIADRHRDSYHPVKRHRPIASGKLTVQRAACIAAFLFMASVLISLLISFLFTAILTIYAVMQTFYTYRGKDMVGIDILLVASGFILRMFAGAVAFEVTVSSWLFICLFTLSLILATGKRLSECLLLPETAARHRDTLAHYSVALLRRILTAAAGASCLFYLLYALEHRKFLVTLPFVLAGITRYLLLVSRGYGEPIDAVLNDRLLAAVVILWLILVILTQYEIPVPGLRFSL